MRELFARQNFAKFLGFVWIILNFSWDTKKEELRDNLCEYPDLISRTLNSPNFAVILVLICTDTHLQNYRALEW